MIDSLHVHAKGVDALSTGAGLHFRRRVEAFLAPPHFVRLSYLGDGWARVDGLWSSRERFTFVVRIDAGTRAGGA